MFIALNGIALNGIALKCSLRLGWILWFDMVDMVDMVDLVDGTVAGFRSFSFSSVLMDG